MRQILLPDNTKTSALGFGCAPILGSVNAHDSRRAIKCALDEGITHFDLARVYGFGKAEDFVGEYVREFRQSITLTSKFGIEPDWKVQYLNFLKPIVRAVKNKMNGGKGSNSKIAGGLNKRILISSDLVCKSLEKSLKELKTDYIDVYMIHEPIATINEIEEVILALKKAQKQGKINSYGISLDHQYFSVHDKYLKYFEIIQSNFDLKIPNYYKSKIHFGLGSNDSINGDINVKLKFLNENHEKDLVLMSMFNCDHIRNNAKIFSS
jgi:aryl-alcohol dehydrogenase-like predicted oxidoreductase